MVKISAEFSILICTHLLFVKLKYIQQRENRLRVVSSVAKCIGQLNVLYKRIKCVHWTINE